MRRSALIPPSANPGRLRLPLRARLRSLRLRFVRPSTKAFQTGIPLCLRRAQRQDPKILFIGVGFSLISPFLFLFVLFQEKGCSYETLRSLLPGALRSVFPCSFLAALCPPPNDALRVGLGASLYGGSMAHLLVFPLFVGYFCLFFVLLPPFRHISSKSNAFFRLSETLFLSALEAPQDRLRGNSCFPQAV